MRKPIPSERGEIGKPCRIHLQLQTASTAHNNAKAAFEH